MTTAVTQRSRRSLTAPGPPFRLREVQTALALVIGLRLATRDWTLVAERPGVLTDTSWFIGLVPVTPTSTVVVALQVLGLIGVAAVVIRRSPRIGFAVAWLCYVILTGWWGSSGKVTHNDLLTVSVAAVLLFSAWPRAAAQEKPTVAAGWPPRAALIVLAAIYFITGAQKLVHSGPGWVFSDNMSWVLLQGAEPRAQDIALWMVDHGWAGQLLAGGALALELSAPLLLAFRVTRLPFVFGVAVMHLSIWYMLGLDYFAWILTAAAVAIPMALPRDARLTDVAGRLQVLTGAAKWLRYPQTRLRH